MVLDYQTLLFTSILAGYGYALIFVLTWLRRREEVYLLIWGLGLVCLATGLWLALISPTAPDEYLTPAEGLIVHLLFAGSFSAGWIGVRRFDGKPTPLPSAAAAAAAAPLAYWAVMTVGALPAHALAAMYLGLMLPCGLLAFELLWCRTGERLPSRTLAGVAFSLYLLTFAVSAGLSMIAGPDPMSEEAVQSAQIALVVNEICMLLAYVGLLAMSGERAHVELEQLATVDPLTGLLNRRGLATWADRLLAKPGWRPESIALLLLDIDRFKRVNDDRGHDAGDAVLVHLARRAQASALRGGDLFARYGGEEFVAVLPGATVDQAVAVAERLRQDIASERFTFAGSDIQITVSIGVAAVEPRDRTLEPAISRADAALYAAKQAGRDRVVA